ncbi:MAG: lamin tail domain-containing protein [Patescibacteria group bacterium]|nr:lamin tail domain-containing protein [Patescibacteria group bacterium]
MKKVVLFLLISIFLLIGQTIQATAKPILINQILLGQNEGAKNEFIELYNPNDIPINLENYTLKKKSSSGNESVLVSNKSFIGVIPAKSYFLISSPEFGPQIKADLYYSNSNSLSKNNTIILYDNNKEISDKLGYGQVLDFHTQPADLPENNQVLKRIKTDLNSPNNFSDFSIEKNNIQLHNSLGNTITINNYQEEIISTSSSNKNSSTKKGQKNIYYSDLKNYKKLSDGDLITIEGVVSVLPGSLGTQYFYIHNNYKDDTNVYGLQIYNYNKKFPELKIGDYLKINGELVVNENGSVLNYKLKTKEIEDIKIMSSGQEIIRGPIEKIANFQMTDLGNLKKIKGEITQNKTKQIYLDDGQEIMIEIKKGSGISNKIFKEGQEFIVSGILGYSSNQLKLTLIDEKDIEALQKNDEKPLGEVLNDDFWEVENKKYYQKILQYLGLTIIISLIFLIFKKKIIKN